MPVDTSIYSNLLRPAKSVAEYDAEARSAQMEKLNLLAARQKMADMDAARREQDALARVLPTIDRKAPDALAKLYQVAPRSAPAIVKQWQEQELTEAKIGTETAQGKKYEAETGKAKAAAAGDKMKAFAGIVQGALLAHQQGGPQAGEAAYQRGIQSLRQMGILSPEDPVAPNFDPQGAAAFLDYDKEMQRYVSMRGQDLSAETSRRGQDMVDRRTREEGALGRAVTMRGQNLTDARQRQANDVQKQLVLQERELKVGELQAKADDRKRSREAGISSAANQIAVIDKALDHPGRATATGLSGSLDPRNYVPGTNARDFQTVLDQIGGTAFLQAFESLKGGGQITEVEGRKATEAIARLNRAQSDKEFEQSLRDLREVMTTGYKRLSGQDYQRPGKAKPSGLSPQEQAELEQLRARFGKK